MGSIVKRSMTGWQSFDQIKYVAIFDPIFRARMPMYFYTGGSLKYVVDISRGYDGNSIRITVYPHNAADVIAQSHKIFASIKEELDKRINAGSSIDSFITMDIGGSNAKVITEQDFTGLYPTIEAQDSMFIFKGSKRTSFPRLYFVEKTQRIGTFQDVFSIMANTSHNIMSCAGDSTEVGKDFTYFLIQSFRSRQMVDKIPNLGSINFPTKGDDSVTNIIDLEPLKKFADKCHLEKIVVTTKGHKAVEEPPVQDSEDVISAAEASADRLLLDINKEIDADNPPWRNPVQFPFGMEDTKQLGLRIQQSVLEKNSIDLGDLLRMGILETLGMIPITDQIIYVDSQMAEGIRKMCIYENQVHIVPTYQGVFDPMEYFGESDSLFHICTEDTFPRRAELPAPKTDNTNYVQ